MQVSIPTLLRSYTRDAALVELAARPPGAVDDVLRELDARFPGIRFRIVDEQGRVRRHMKLFLDGALVSDLATPVRDARELMIVGALSGG